MKSHYTDLRLNREQRSGSEGFWPSFADIITVMLMIFLMAMVILLIRNWELVAQLQNSIAAEKQAAQLARSTEEQNNELAEQIAASDRELNMLRLQLMAYEDQLEALKQHVKIQDDKLNALETSRALFQKQKEELEVARTDLLEQLNSRTEALASAEQKQRTLDERIQALRQSNVELTQQTAEQLAQYSELKRKYDRLVRPARSPKGRYVVEVVYQKHSDSRTILLKHEDAAEIRKVNPEQLHAELQKLKSSKDNNLYVRVIFPKNSLLSHDEAWNFTTSVLRRYDYYYQNDEP